MKRPHWKIAAATLEHAIRNIAKGQWSEAWWFIKVTWWHLGLPVLRRKAKLYQINTTDGTDTDYAPTITARNEEEARKQLPELIEFMRSYGYEPVGDLYYVCDIWK
jgi:hypothetical protein